MEVFIDFDNTIVNTIEAIVSLYNEDFAYYKKFKPVHWTDINTWDFVELRCANKEYINTYFNQPRFFKKIQYMPFALTVIKNLYDIGCKITVVSCGYSPNIKLKEKWMAENIPYVEFIGVNFKEYSDKSHIDMSNGILIDDSLSNLETSNAKYKVCFGDEYSWNDKWNGVRCHNWCDVMRYIDKNIVNVG